MKNRSDRLKYLMGLRRIDQNALAQAVGCSQTNISKLVNNESATSSYLYAISRVLNVDMEWIETGKGRDPRLIGLIEVGKIPIIEWDEVQKNIDIFELISKKQREALSNFGKGGSNTYALRVIGDSMLSTVPSKASFPEGSIIIIDPDKAANNNDFVIAIKNNDKYPIFAQYINYGGNFYLKPLNSQYPTLIISPEIEIVGSVISQVNIF